MSATLIHPNSAAAYHATTRERSNLESRVMGLMADGKARTDRQIAAELELTEKINPRITTLVLTGQLHEVGSTNCEVTQKKVRLTRRFL